MRPEETALAPEDDHGGSSDVVHAIVGRDA
jgi:hypothetical protein